MGIYNTVRASMRRPRRKGEAEMRVDLCFVVKDLINYKLGDQIRWEGRKTVVLRVAT